MTASHAQNIHKQLESDILTHLLKPGERLDENRLARRFGTSRTPVREAIRQLASENLAQIVPFKGAVVVRQTPQEVNDLIEVIAELEGACGRLAARGCFADQLVILLKAYDQCAAAERIADAQAYESADQAFHHAIHVASGNNFLIAKTRAAYKRIEFCRHKVYWSANHMSGSLAEHKAIIDAISKGASDEADNLLRRHLRTNDLLRLYQALCETEIPRKVA